MTKAGPSLGRATMIRAADTARKLDPQLARISCTQMTERGANHLKACCVVAGHLALRRHAAMLRGAPCQLRDTDGTPVTPGQARQVIAAHWTVPDDVRQRRRSRKTQGRTPHQASKPIQRGDPPRRLRKTLPAISTSETGPAGAPSVNVIAETETRPTASPRDDLDTAISIGNQIKPFVAQSSALISNARQAHIGRFPHLKQSVWRSQGVRAAATAGGTWPDSL